MPGAVPNPRRRVGGCQEGVAMSPEGSLTLSKLQSANEKRVAFWVTSLIHLLLPLKGNSNLCYVPCGDWNENRWCASHVPRPRAGTATYATVVGSAAALSSTSHLSHLTGEEMAAEPQSEVWT